MRDTIGTACAECTESACVYVQFLQKRRLEKPLLHSMLEFVLIFEKISNAAFETGK